MQGKRYHFAELHRQMDFTEAVAVSILVNLRKLQDLASTTPDQRQKQSSFGQRN